MSVTVGMLLCEWLSQGGWEVELKRLFSPEFTSRDGCLRAEVIPHTERHPAHLPMAGRSTISLLALCPSEGELVVLADRVECLWVHFCFPLE